MQRHDSRHNEVIFHAVARWLSKGKVRVCFSCDKSCGFSLLNKDTLISTDFKAIFGFIKSEVSVMYRAAIYCTYEEIDLFYSHVAATAQKTAGHGTRNTKINESRSSCS